MPRKKVESEFLYCKERAKSEGAYYLKKGIGLTILNHTEGSIGYFDGWELAIAPDTTYKGITQQQLINKLQELWPLKQRTEHTKEKVVIYTQNIHKVQGFFEQYITDAFEDFYCILSDFYEIRPCERWFSAKKDAAYMASQAQKIIDEFFIPEKYFYITPQQRNRKYILKHKDCKVADASYPASWNSYCICRKAYFSGILYNPYKEYYFGQYKPEKIMLLDITSSYIFDLLCCKFPSSERRRVKNLDVWEYYISAENVGSLGLYEISYAAPTNMVSCYTDYNGTKLEPGEHTVQMVLTNVDLANMLAIGYVRSVKPVWLYEYDMDYLPKYVVEPIVDAYIAKMQAKDDDEKAIRKPILNGMSGDACRKYTSEEDFLETRKNPGMSPLWGIFMNAYAKKYLLKLALALEKGSWLYSDTDSIICLDTEHNRTALAEFNSYVSGMVSTFCKNNNYDFNVMSALGSFKEEAKITKLKVWATKTYVYKTTDGKVVLKAAGLVKDNVVMDDKLFELDELDYTKTKFPIVVPAEASKTGEGYYAELKPENKAQYYLLLRVLQNNNKFYKSNVNA